jgi:hypothetical protein
LGGTAEGWRLQPWSDGLWYLAKDASTQSRTVPSLTDFSKIFVSN